MLFKNFENSIFKSRIQILKTNYVHSAENVEKANKLMQQALGVLSTENTELDLISKLETLINNSNEWNTRVNFLKNNFNSLETYVTFKNSWDKDLNIGRFVNDNTSHLKNSFEQISLDQKSRIINTHFKQLANLASINIKRWKIDQIGDDTVNPSIASGYTTPKANIIDFLEKVYKLYVNKFNWELFKTKSVIDVLGSYSYTNGQNFKFTRKYKSSGITYTRKQVFDLDTSNDSSTVSKDNGFDYHEQYRTGYYKESDYSDEPLYEKYPNGYYGSPNIYSEFYGISKLIKTEKTLVDNILKDLKNTSSNTTISNSAYNSYYSSLYDSENVIFRTVQFILLNAYNQSNHLAVNNLPAIQDDNKQTIHLGGPRQRSITFNVNDNVNPNRLPNSYKEYELGSFIINYDFQSQFSKTGANITAENVAIQKYDKLRQVAPGQWTGSNGMYVVDTVKFTSSIPNVGNGGKISISWLSSMQTHIRAIYGVNFLQNDTLANKYLPGWKMNNHKFIGWFDNDLGFSK